MNKDKKVKDMLETEESKERVSEKEQKEIAKKVMDEILAVVRHNFGESAGIAAMIKVPDQGGRHQIIHNINIVEVVSAAFAFFQFAKEKGAQDVLDVFSDFVKKGLDPADIESLLLKLGPRGLKAAKDLLGK